MLVAGLSTGHKLGLGLVGLAFILFALSSSFVFPRLRPDFPGRGLKVFLAVAVGFFVAMLAAVQVFGKEGGEAKAGEKRAAAPAGAVQVQEKEFKIVLPSTTLSAGAHTFSIQDVGKLPHNLAIIGPGVTAQSPTINPGKSTTLTATLKKGTYDFFCSVPGHKQQGMDVKVTVS